MNINMHTVNFTSRSATVRKADKICRLVNNTYPAYSPSKIMCKSYFKKDMNAYKIANRLQEDLKEFVRTPLQSIKDMNLKLLYFKTLSDKIKKFHIANCEELMNLASLTCSVNKIKSLPVKLLAVDEKDIIKKEIDHVVLAIPLSDKGVILDRMSRQKDVIIIDPWLGIADYAPNIERRYKDCPDIMKLPNNIRLGLDTYIKAADSVPETLFENLREMFPELIIN